MIGLCLFLLYGTHGWFEPGLAEAGVKVPLLDPGDGPREHLRSLPFVVRESAGATGDRH